VSLLREKDSSQWHANSRIRRTRRPPQKKSMPPSLEPGGHVGACLRTKKITALSKAGPRSLVVALLTALGLHESCGAIPSPQRTAAEVKAEEAPLVEIPEDGSFDGKIRIASVFPTVGRYALSGVQSHNGARLAVDDLNRSGGVLGRQLRLVEYRTGSYFTDARFAAEHAARSGAVAIVGSNASSLSKAIAEIADSQGIVQISNVSTAQDLTWNPATGETHPFVFRVCNSDVVLGHYLAEFAREHLRATRVAVLYEVGRTYSAKLARSFMEGLGSSAHVAAFQYLPLETDFRSQLKEIETFQAEVLFLPGSFTDATLVAMQARRQGVRATLIGGDAWSSRLLFKRGGPAEASYYANHCFPQRGFLDAYRRRFGDEPDGCRAALAYDAVRAVASGIGSMGPLEAGSLQGGLAATRVRLRQALGRIRLEGQAGSIHFDSRGDVSRGVAINQILPGPAGGYVTRPYIWLGTH